MELDNTAMEIRLETARNQLLIQKWDKERTLAKRRKEKEPESKEGQDQGRTQGPLVDRLTNGSSFCQIICSSLFHK